MRSDDVDVSGKAHGNRVIVFGDSVVNGGSQTSHEDLATSLLQRDLRRSGVDAWVGNVSAGSWGPGNWKAYAQEYGFFDADVVVLVLSSHDYADNPGFAPLNPRTHPTEKPGTAIAELVFRYGPRYLGLGAGDPDRYDAPVSDAASARGLADLAAFLQLAKRQTPNVAVLHHWERSEIESGTARHGFARIRQLCETLGIPFRTMDADFRESIRTGSMPYRDNIHINERGQFLVYRNLARQVQEMQALPR